MDSLPTHIELHRLLAAGLSVKEAAEEMGISVQRAYNIKTGRTKSVSTPRSDAGRSRNGIYETLVPIAKEMYVNQGKRKNLQDVIHRVYDDAIRKYADISESTLGRYVREAAKRENWDVLWLYRNDKPGLNQILPKNQYDRTEWPFMGFFSMDNRTSDIWVFSESQNKLIRPHQYFIVEVRTQFVLGYACQERAFTRHDVARLCYNTFRKWSPPLYGFILDNGSEQVGGWNIPFLETAFDPEYLAACRIPNAVPELHLRFPEARSPIILSIPRTPQFPGKASNERLYAGEHRYEARVSADNYAGTGRGDQVCTTSTRSPHRTSNTWTFREFEQYTHWRFNAAAAERFEGLIPYRAETHPVAFCRFSQETGLPPTVEAAWQHSVEGFAFQVMPEERLLQMFTYTEKYYPNKRVTKINQVNFQHNNIKYSFSHPDLTYLLFGKTVDVILDPNDDTRALLLHDGRVIGIGDDLNRKRQRTAGGITMAESRYLQALNRSAAKASVRSAMQDIGKRLKTPVPDVEPEHMSRPGIELQGISHGDLIDMVTQNRLDTNTEPAEMEIDNEILERQARISRLTSFQK